MFDCVAYACYINNLNNNTDQRFRNLYSILDEFPLDLKPVAGSITVMFMCVNSLWAEGFDVSFVNLSLYGSQCIHLILSAELTLA